MSESTAEEERLDAVSRVAASVQMEEVRLRYITSVLGISNPRDLPPDWAEHVELTHDVEVVDSGGEPSSAVDPGRTGFLVNLTFRAEFGGPLSSDTADGGQITEGSGEEDQDRGEAPLPDFGLFAIFELAYSLRETGDLTNGDIRAFAEINSVFNCWPYWRELAQSTSQRMNLEHPLVVPVKTVNRLLVVDDAE